MANVKNTLLPPIVETFMPAFGATNNAVIYFSVPAINVMPAVTGWKIHFTLVGQKTNQKALSFTNNFFVESDRGSNPMGIEILEYKDTEDSFFHFDEDAGMYKLVIDKGLLKEGQFLANQFYKVQIRFDVYTNTEYNFSSLNEKTKYLTNCVDYFSEWSTVCLIRPIDKPALCLDQFYDNTLETPEAYKPFFNRGLISISGRLSFQNTSTTTEYLQSYYIEIYKTGDLKDELIYTSDIYYTSNQKNKQEISCTIDTVSFTSYVEPSVDYIFRLYYTTNNQYQGQSDDSLCIFRFDSAKEWSDLLASGPTASTQIDNEDGFIKITVKGILKAEQRVILIMRRSCSLDNFVNWEILDELKISSSVGKTVDIEKEFKDYTVESLSWYKYQIQLYDCINGKFCNTKYIADTSIVPEGVSDLLSGAVALMTQAEDTLIFQLDKQLPIRYNFQISSYKPTVNRTKIDTLGGKYPKFVENALLNYKQINLTGRISAEADVYRTFLKESDYFSERGLSELYKQYKKDADVIDVERNDFLGDKDSKAHYVDGGSSSYFSTPENDVLWERIFRDKAIEWLNNGESKLLKTKTEGNIGLMFTDISLTPDKSLGRRLYDFTATAYEITDVQSLESLEKAKIISRTIYQLGTQNNDAVEQRTDFGQITDLEGAGSDGLKTILERHLQYKYGGTSYTPSYQNVKNVKVYFVPTPTSKLPKYQIALEDNEVMSYETNPGVTFDVNLTSMNLELTETSDTSIKFEELNDGVLSYTQKEVQQEATPKGHRFYYDENKQFVRVDSETIVSDKECYIGYKLNVEDNAAKTPSIAFVPYYGTDSIRGKGYNGSYFSEEDTEISNIYFDYDDNAFIEYEISYGITNTASSTTRTGATDKIRLGQLAGPFESGYHLKREIQDRYRYITTNALGQTVVQKIKNWYAMSIDTAPMVIFKWTNVQKPSDESDWITHFVGPTGFLTIEEMQPVYDLYFIGRRYFKTSNDRPREFEFYYNGEIWSNSITPIERHVYKDQNTVGLYYFYSNNQTYTFNNSGFSVETTFIDIEQTVDGMLTYRADIIKETTV